jgi:hypothetical protein
VKFHEAPQLHGVPHGILEVLNTILYETEFQNPQIFHQHARFSPERSTLNARPFQLEHGRGYWPRSRPDS